MSDECTGMADCPASTHIDGCDLHRVPLTRIQWALENFEPDALVLEQIRSLKSASRTPARHDLPYQLRSLCCDPDVWGSGDHGHTSCAFMHMAADEIERMRLVLGELTAAKSKSVSRWSHAKFKARRRLIEIHELRDQNQRLITELLAYRAEEAASYNDALRTSGPRVRPGAATR